jgi:hypothetical protein
VDLDIDRGRFHFPCFAIRGRPGSQKRGSLDRMGAEKEA